MNTRQTTPKPAIIFARVDDALRMQIRAEADRRFEGNESLVVREAVRLYLRLRHHLGPAFEPTLQGIAPVATEPVEVAA